MAEQAQAPSTAGIAARQSNLITGFRQRLTNFLNDLPLDVDSAKRLAVTGMVFADGNGRVKPGQILDGAFDGENNHLDAQTLADGVDVVVYLEQILLAPQERYEGRSIAQVMAAIPR